MNLTGNTIGNRGREGEGPALCRNRQLRCNLPGLQRRHGRQLLKQLRLPVQPSLLLGRVS